MKTVPAPAAAAMEEFHESDVLWPDHGHQCHRQKQQLIKGSRRGHAAACGGVARRRPASSAPVAIPEPATRCCCCCEDDDEEKSLLVPPHVVVARRRRAEENAACSMCVGQGRTLKGRDLQCVRTAVLRMTGFLEP
ncbi:hypothetical protein QOZ80_5BG0414170 [Eleusine coracana subsp. coracana]|nr:hypothetical protein QOZ80_5BG0414170 [Eleusine coracana subsp. coracana]